MLKKLSLENFRSHKKTELEFSPGVNIIKDYVIENQSSRLAKRTSNETGRAEVATEIIMKIHEYDRRFGHAYLLDRELI